MDDQKNDNQDPNENGPILNTPEFGEVGAVTVEIISRGEAPTSTHPNDVFFKVKYPKDWEGEKTMPEGVVVVSKESAEHFASLGIGSIVKNK